MPTNRQAPAPAWEPFTIGGREFLRIGLPDPEGSGASFAVAREVGGRFEVGDVLAVGEFSVLLLARDLRTQRGVVLKALRSDLYPRLTGPAARDALVGAVRHARHLLQTERRLIVRLRNAGSNAVPVPVDYVYDRNPALDEVSADPFLTETEPYLVLQRLSGVTLEAALAHEHPSGMEERSALRAILPVVRALEVLHRPWRLPSGRTWHCVYQDLKPANLMVDPSGRLTLIDFGGCQVVVDGVPVLEGSCTPGYAPPECEGPGPARVLLACADVFTIGRTLLHMLTGSDPRARSGPGRPPPSCSPGVHRLLERCLAPKPSERFADARQVAAAITGLLAEDAA